MVRFAKRLFIALAGLGLLAGCGATGAVNNARQELLRAQQAGAEQRAPYEYYAAEAYLEMAEHENWEVDRKAAEEYAAKSVQFSTQALQKSQ